jgi:hypothetical protein
MASQFTTFELRQSPKSSDRRFVLWLSVCLLLGIALVVFQYVFIVTTLAIAALLLVYSATCRHMQFWQGLTLFSLTGFIILNYGFENLVLGRIGGAPILIGEIMMLSGLALAVWRWRDRVTLALFRDPAMLSVVFLWMLAAIHLMANIPQFGLYALRDASVFIETIFLLAGFLWAQEADSIRLLNKWLLFVFVANLIYSCTLPIAETLQEHSPASGVFQTVSLFGQYQHNSLYVVSGSLFCIWIARQVVSGKRWILATLACEQLCALVVLQTRSMYLGILIVILILFLIGERQKLSSLGATIAGGVAAVAVCLIVVTVSNINIHGRVVDLTADSIGEHAMSLFSVTSQNERLGQDDDRLDWLKQVWIGTTSDAATLIFGQGFGKPLINYEADGVVVRQPHNSTMGVFGRLGVVGVSVWILFHLLVLARFTSFIRSTRGMKDDTRDFVIWLFTFYVLAMILSMVQPTIEFSHCAVPLYFMMGLALGVIPDARVANLLSMKKVPETLLSAANAA